MGAGGTMWNRMREVTWVGEGDWGESKGRTWPLGGSELHLSGQFLEVRGER